MAVSYPGFNVDAYFDEIQDLWSTWSLL